MSICQFSFNIAQWQIVANKVISPQDWQQGEQHWRTNASNWEVFSPKLAFLPPLKRRRLSDSARLFFEAGWDLVQNQADIPVVYASSNSEINRSFALWQTLLQEGDVSPTSFSLSVHNALVGQWSEFKQVKSETTAITARSDNLETALLEAYLLLKEGHQRILVVVAESPLYEEYNAQPVVRPPFAYALAMVVEQGSQFHLQLQENALENQVDNALFWVQQQHLDNKTWQTASSTGGRWLWQKS